MNQIDSDSYSGSNDSTDILDYAYCKCRESITEGFQQPHPVLIHALPAMGKSSGIVKWAAKNQKPVSIFTERKELYDQYIDWCEQRDLSVDRLPAFQRDCPTMPTEKEEMTELASKLSELYNAGIGAKDIHANSEQLLGTELPCQNNGTCCYVSDQPDIENTDVLIGHYTHAHVDEYIQDRYVVFDESPGNSLLETYSSDKVNASVTHFLESEQDLPFDTPTDLIEYRWDTNQSEQAVSWFQDHAHVLNPNPTAMGSHRDAIHVMGSVLTYGLLKMDDLGNGWEAGNIDENRRIVRNRGTGEVTILASLDLTQAESVLALDGTPTIEKWRLVLGDDLEQHNVLTKLEKKQYMSEGLELELIQTSEDLKPYAGGNYVTEIKDELLFKTITDREGQKPTLITSRKAIAKYEESGAAEYFDESEHYGNLKGTNRFSTVRLGVVTGSIEPGDDEIKKWAAIEGTAIESNGEKGMKRGYGELGNALLEDTREKEVLQAVMRFGREEEDSRRGAKVYVHTAAVPDWVPIDEQTLETHLWSSKADGMEQVLSAIEAYDDWSTSDIVGDELVSISRKQILRNLRTLREYRYIDGKLETGRGYSWQDIHASEASPTGHAELV